MPSPVVSWTLSSLLALSALGGAVAVEQDELIASALAAASGADNGACDAIAKAVSSKSQVFYPLTSQYHSAQYHWMSSSSQSSACAVEVGSDADTAVVMRVIGRKKAPFAIKSGGHASNPGYSSTPGVQISLARMKQIKLSADKKSVTVGLGNTWTEVYKALDGTGYNVVGGRVSGPGTGGFTLGGGYSWLTNQYGLTCDTVQQFTLILPNGTVASIGPAQKDLFFALKGGLNRFGIVTRIVFDAVPQVPLVYGGIQVYSEAAIPALINATSQYEQHNSDPKGQVILTINGGASETAILLSFYDGPDRPASFAPYDNITPKPILSTVKTQSFYKFASGTPSEIQAGSRGAFHGMATTRLTTGFMQACYNETQYYKSLQPLNVGTLLSYDIEPFADAYGSHATDSAYPHANSPRPLNLYFKWTSASNDGFWRDQMRRSVAHLTEVAKAEGIYSDDMFTYPNYALDSLTGDQLYGPTNAARLRQIQASVDPQGVMKLAGGFTF